LAVKREGGGGAVFPVFLRGLGEQGGDGTLGAKGGQGGESGHASDEGDGDREAIGGAAVGCRAKDGLEAGFEGQGAGHADCECRRSAGGRDGQEVAGVEGGLNAVVKDDIVGGGFAFGEKTTPGEPSEGLPPKGREGDAGEKLDGEIVTSDMGEFVEDDVVAAVGGPGGGIGGEEDDRAEKAEGERHGAGGGLEDERVIGEYGAGAAQASEGEEGVGELG